MEAREGVNMEEKCPPRRGTDAAFEIRRLHDLLLFYEHSRTNPTRRRAAGALAKHLRCYLEDFHGLRKGVV
ncbi:MAG: hypothetical protein V2B18_12380 [Pseudomonadota bacterium]